MLAEPVMRNRPGRRSPVGIDRLFDRQHQVGRALDFVDDRAIRISNQSDRIGKRRIARRWIVERNEAPTITEGLRECSLPRLARADDAQHRRIGQYDARTLCGVTRIHGSFVP
jgi:hypothetical protein